eukprot:TRINITY_DN1092_c0_g1_i1.p1 TRINITY_DN1092_c0_g1~~TRINITY_DN1092_c0_g1_i1.p1  ORF type:complete len:652 (+),score=72.85 TRINITY_DN1092_c0_g1_i1:107-2062(+)
MEVKGIGQRIPRPEPDPKSRFESIFDESKRKVDEPVSIALNGVDKHLDLALDVSKMPHLANNPQFIALQTWMDEFYKDIQARSFGTDAPEDGLHLKIVLYECTKKLLREIVNTKDKVLQSSYLQRVHTWFAKRKDQAERKGRKELGVLSEQDIPEPKRYLVVEPPKKLYEEQMRTLHPEIPPPKERLTDFNLKGIKPEAKVETSQKPETEEQDAAALFVPSPPLIQQKIASNAKLDTKLGIEAQSNFIYYQPKDPEEQKVEKLWLAKKNKAIADKRTSEEFQSIVSEWGFAKSRLNENLIRKHENTNYGNNFAVRNSAAGTKRPKTTIGKGQVDYEQIYNEPSSEGTDEEAVTESPRKPLTAMSARKNKPERRPPEVVDLRGSIATAASSMIAALGQPSVIPKTAPAKPPIRPGQKPKEPKPLPKVSTAINEADKMRVDHIRKMYGHLIGENKDNMDTAANIFVNGPKGINTLSIYNKDVKRPYTAQNPSRLSRDLPVTHQGSREQFRMHQMKEINSMKEHLAKEEVPCSIVALQRAVLMPEDYPAFRMTAENFLQPGSRLIVNPFAKKKKKKKGKKKKGKGKKQPRTCYYQTTYQLINICSNTIFLCNSFVNDLYQMHVINIAIIHSHIYQNSNLQACTTPNVQQNSQND